MEKVTEHTEQSKSNHSIIEVLEYCKAQALPARCWQVGMDRV